MRKTRIIFAVLLCGPFFVLSGQAQGLYLGIGGGYGFAAAKQSFFNDYKTTVSASGTSEEATAHPFSLGKGINAGIYAGFMFNENVGAELGISYLIGSKNTFTDETNDNVVPSTQKTEDIWKGSMIRLVPALRITAGDGSLKPYMKAGLIIWVAGKITTEMRKESSSSFSSNTWEENWEYTGGTSLGFHGAIGLNFMVGDKIGIYAEAAGNYQNWAMKKGTMTKYTVNGADELQNMDTSDKEIEFVDSYTVNSASSPNPSQPSQSIKMYMPFSSIGINVGIHFAFGGQ